MRRNARNFLSCLACGAVFATLPLVAPLPALAHHSFAMFDQTKNDVVSGTVTEFGFENPHIHWRMKVALPGSTEAKSYILEGPTPIILKRLGWTRNSLKVGDKIKVQLHPLRDGTPGGQAIKVWLANGQELSLVAEDVQYN